MGIIKQISVKTAENSWNIHDIGADAKNISFSAEGSPINIAGANNVGDALYNILPSSKLNAERILFSDINGKITTGLPSTYLSGLNFNIVDKINEIQNNKISSTVNTNFLSASSQYNEQTANITNPINILKINSKTINDQEGREIGRIATYDRRIDKAKNPVGSNPGDDWGFRLDLYGNQDDDPKASLRIGVKPDTGELDLGFAPDQAEWRKKILNYKMLKQSTDNSINIPSSHANNNYYNIVSLGGLQPGIYIISFHVDYSAHSGGSLRYIELVSEYNNTVATGLGSIGVPPAGGRYTRLTSCTIIDITGNNSPSKKTTIRVRGFQDSQETLRATGQIRCLRLV